MKIIKAARSLNFCSHQPGVFAITSLFTLIIGIPIPALADATVECNTSGSPSSLECGENSVASNSATAVGDSATAGSNSTAVGQGATADSFSTGLGAQAKAVSSATALGYRASAEGGFATAVGDRANAAGLTSIALGRLAQATASGAVALGTSASAATESTAVGTSALAGGFASIALGVDGQSDDNLGAQALAAFTIAIGPDALANEQRAIALGDLAQATGENAIAQGASSSATGFGSTALGFDADATEGGAMALGFNSGATGFNSIAMGPFSSAQGVGAVALGGDGSDEGSGTFPGASALADYTIAIGPDAIADQQRAVALGDRAQANGADAMSLGASALARGPRGVAIGAQTDTGTGNNGVAIGYQVTVAGNNSSAIGIFSSATGNNATTVGVSSAATGSSSSALGRRASASGNFASAFGTDAVAGGSNSTAVGRGAVASALNSMAIGRLAASTVANRIVIGKAATPAAPVSSDQPASTYQLPGLSGTGTRSLVVDENGLVSAETIIESSELSSFNDSPVSQTNISHWLTRSDGQEKHLLALTAMVESLVQRVDALEGQLTQANRALAHAGISSVNPAPLVSIEELQLSGIAPERARTISAVNEQTQIELLALHNTASRNNWLMSDAYHSRRTALLSIENPLRLAIGDDAYRDYLQRTEQPWQVVVETVFSNSAAALAGIEAGDVIESYDGHRVFSGAGLQWLTTQGSIGEQIDITVLRDGIPLTLYVGRGPLGIVSIVSENAATLTAADTAAIPALTM